MGKVIKLKKYQSKSDRQDSVMRLWARWRRAYYRRSVALADKPKHPKAQQEAAEKRKDQDSQQEQDAVQ